jgi:hypothetical protein
MPCRNWTRTGNCPYGDRCHFSHQTDFAPVPPPQFNSPFQNPQQQPQQPFNKFAGSPSPSAAGGFGPNTQLGVGPTQQMCRNWNTSGSCKYGDKCFYKDSHIQKNKPQSQNPSSQKSSQTNNAITDKLGDLSLNTNKNTNGNSITGSAINNVLDFTAQWEDTPYDEDNEEEDEQDSLDPDDIPEDFHQQPLFQQGSMCAVENCKGELKEVHSETSGKFLFFQCLHCSTIFTNPSTTH